LNIHAVNSKSYKQAASQMLSGKYDAAILTEA